MAQAGSDSEVSSCGTGCSYKYDIWYEFFGYNIAQVVCDTNSNSNLNYGDSITASVVPISLGSGNYEMQAEAYDNTQSLICESNTGSSSPYMGQPDYAQFMGEFVTALPKFSQVSVSSAFYYLPGDTYGHYIGSNFTNAYFIADTSNQNCDCYTNLTYNVWPTACRAVLSSTGWSHVSDLRRTPSY